MRKAAMTCAALVGVAFVAVGIEAVQSRHAATAPTTAPATAPAAKYRAVLIEGVPHVRQRPDFCGEACAEMVLRKLGHAITQDDVFDASGTDPIHGRGCRTAELAAALKKIGFQTGDVWRRVSAAGAEAEMAAQFKALHADLLKGVPSIVCMHYDDKPDAAEHFRLVLGYDPKRDEVIYHEPAEAKGSYRRIGRAALLKLWPLKYDRARWTVIRFRMEPGKITAPARREGRSDADFAQHVRKLRKKIPAGRGFEIVIQRPFVVIGDEPPRSVSSGGPGRKVSMVGYRATDTVKWAVDKLKQDYFAADPTEIMDIWLFKDDASYRKHALEIFGDKPTTPYGYCSREHGALIMNIATGGGTLVHEIVHPFLRADFPACPSWFDEGLASLYEQSAARGGHIIGRTNWRLAGLQKAIRKKSVPSFQTLTGTTRHEFYNKDSGTNYAQARYLCYWLQEHGLLVKFYHAFRANHKTDPTGYETLRKTLGVEDMDAFQKKWQDWVLKLRFP